MRVTKKLYNKNTEEKRGKPNEVPLRPQQSTKMHKNDRKGT
jgi:hypothetical protein